MRSRRRSFSRPNAKMERLANRVWARCGAILQLRWQWSLVWAEAWQIPREQCGSCRPTTREILLDRGLCPDSTVVAIAHEARQAAFYEAGASNRNDAEGREFARWFFLQHGVELLKETESS